LDGFIKDVNSAFEGLQQLLEKWKTHNISALTKCHSALKAQVKAAIAQAAKQALNPEFKTSSDLLENFMLSSGSEMLLLKSLIEKSEAAIAQACVITIKSDLCEVEAAFHREYSEGDFHVERPRGEEALKAELIEASSRADNLIRQNEEVENQHRLMEQDYRSLLTKISTMLNVQVEDSRTATRALSQSWTVATNKKAELTSDLAKQQLAFENMEQLATTRKKKSNTLHAQIEKLSEDFKNKEDQLNSRISKLREASRKDAEELKKRENAIKELERQLNNAGDSKKLLEVRSSTETEALDKPQEPSSLRSSRSDLLLRSLKPFTGVSRRKQIQLWKCPLCGYDYDYKIENCKSCHQPRPTWKCLECEGSNNLLESKCSGCGHIREVAEPISITQSPRHPVFELELSELSEETSELMVSGKKTLISPRLHFARNRQVQTHPKVVENKWPEQSSKPS